MRPLPLHLCLALLYLTSCGEQAEITPVPDASAIDLTGFSQEPVAGSDLVFVSRVNGQDGARVTGFVAEGRKAGTWSYYEGDPNLPKRQESFVRGKLNGPVLEMDNRGRLTKRIEYLNGVPHGSYVEYRLGRPVKTATYKGGQLDGVLAEYDYRDGKLKQDAEYRGGVLHGRLNHYDPDGKVMLSYTYRDGERVD